ncbi:MAG: S41 family peptidase [Pseudoxanthomonas sp.]
MTPPRKIVVLVAMSLTAMLHPLHASAAIEGRLSAQQREAALQAIKTEFDKGYVFPEMRPKIISRLDSRQRAGDYDTDDPVQFADRITSDLREVSDDRHLSLRVDATAYSAAKAEPGDDAGEDAYYRGLAERSNHGLSELKVLPGNIRYLRITGFQWIDDETGVVYDAAMRFLHGGDAVVIDLRNNGGGSHGAVRYLVSHFLDPDTLELSFLEGSKPPSQSRTLDYLPAGRLKGKPLYVLINGQTASAAEAFAYDVQQFHLGELIGAKTVGAANNNKLVPIAPGFILSVSYGRPLHAVSGGNWEGKGVAPDVEVPPEQALEVAQAKALQDLLQGGNISPEQRRDYAWAQAGVAAKLQPAELDKEMFPRLAGRYAKPGTSAAAIDVAARDDALWLTLSKRPAARLTPLSKELFAVEGYESLRVRLRGDSLELIWRDEAAPRVYRRE